MTARPCLLIGCLLLGAAHRAGAQGSRPPDSTATSARAVQPERPSVATHAGTVAPGYLEIETGVERDRSADSPSALLVPTVLKLGLAPRVQLSMQLPVVAATGVGAGLGDVAVGVKWRAIDGHRWLEDVALLPSLKLATGGARGTSTTDASLLLIDSRSVGTVDVDLNAGATWRSGDGTRAPRRSTMWAVASGIPLRGRLGLALECSGAPGTAGPAGAPPTVALLFGPTFLLRPELALDAGVITPIAGPQPHALYAGLVANTGRLLPSSWLGRP